MLTDKELDELRESLKMLKGAEKKLGPFTRHWESCEVTREQPCSCGLHDAMIWLWERIDQLEATLYQQGR